MHKWTDAVAPGLVDVRSVSAQQCQYKAPAPGFYAVGSHSMGSINPVWGMAGRTPITPLGGRAYDGASACARADDHTGRHSSAPPAASNTPPPWDIVELEIYGPALLVVETIVTSLCCAISAL